MATVCGRLLVVAGGSFCRNLTAVVLAGAVLAGAGCSTTPRDPKKAVQLLQAGRGYRFQGDFGAATMSFNAALTVDPYCAAAHYELGIEYLRGRIRLEDAVKAFERAYDLDPQIWEARQYLVDALRLLGDRERALAVQEELAQDKPEVPEVQCNLGSLLLAERRWEDALGPFRTALSLRPDYPLAEAGLGTALWRSGSVKEGIAALRRAAPRLPERRLFRLELARALIAGGQTDDARVEAEHLLELEPKGGLIYHVLAEIAVAEGDMERARDMARRALALGCRLDPRLRDRVVLTEPDTGEGARQ